MQQESIVIVLPLIAIMVTGYLVGYFKLLPEGSSLVFSRFVFLVAMPPFIFIKLTRIPVEDFFNWPFLGALGGGMLGIFAFSFLVARFAFPGSLSAHSLHALCAMYSSTAYIGLPIIVIIFGDAGLVPAIIGAVITGVVFLPIAIILIELDRGRGHGKVASASLLAVLRNPVLVTTAAGLLVSASGHSVPGPVGAFCDFMGDAFIPCALFAAGLFLSGCSVQGEIKEISWLVVVKLLLHPLLTWWLAFHVFKLEGILPVIAVLQAGLPSGVPVFVLAQHYNTFVARSSAVIVLSTMISMLSLAALLLVLL